MRNADCGKIDSMRNAVSNLPVPMPANGIIGIYLEEQEMICQILLNYTATVLIECYISMICFPY